MRPLVLLIDQRQVLRVSYHELDRIQQHLQSEHGPELGAFRSWLEKKARHLGK
jgi:hypothetical protein